MDRINYIWSTLESKTQLHQGFEKIRYSETSPCNLFLGLKVPEKFRILSVQLNFDSHKLIQTNNQLKGLKIEKVIDNDFSDKILLNLVLTDISLKEIFDVLLYDLITNILDLSDDREIIKMFFNRLEQWKSMFDKFNPEGLLLEEQRGLYGELYFLRKVLKKYPGEQQKILQLWTGPEKENRDFQGNIWAVEVKTTHGNNHQKIHISNERQLDSSNLEYLYLVHFSLDVHKGNGETLNQIVNEISRLLDNDFIASRMFKTKLINVGYFDIHQHLYSDMGYFIRQENYYDVKGDFPRIQEKDLMRGVGDVKYSIIVADCLSYIVPENLLFERIKTK